jgi:hypothetical protein
VRCGSIIGTLLRCSKIQVGIRECTQTLARRLSKYNQAPVEVGFCYVE